MADCNTGLIAFLGILVVCLGYTTVVFALEARMYRKSRNRWREAFWLIGPTIGKPPEGVENIDD